MPNTTYIAVKFNRDKLIFLMAMAFRNTYASQLYKGRHNKKLIVRVIRMWNSYNTRKFMGAYILSLSMTRPVILPIYQFH